jgi:hypothetical protein
MRSKIITTVSVLWIAALAAPPSPVMQMPALQETSSTL